MFCHCWFVFLHQSCCLAKRSVLLRAPSFPVDGNLWLPICHLLWVLTIGCPLRGSSLLFILNFHYHRHTYAGLLYIWSFRQKKYCKTSYLSFKKFEALFFFFWVQQGNSHLAEDKVDFTHMFYRLSFFFHWVFQSWFRSSIRCSVVASVNIRWIVAVTVSVFQTSSCLLGKFLCIDAS